MSITSRELNYLIWRYMQESGFELAAYALNDAVDLSETDKLIGETTPIGMLVKLVQKGIQLTEIEATIRKVGRDESDKKAYTLLSALELDKQLHPEKQLELDPSANGDVEMKQAGDDDQNDNQHSSSLKNSVQVQVDAMEEPPISDLRVVHSTSPSACAKWSPLSDNCVVFGGHGDLKVTILRFDDQQWDSVPSKTILNHTLPPLSSVVEGGDNNATKAENGNDDNSDGKDELEITNVSWNRQGTNIATATFDGQLKIWTDRGKLRYSLSLHRAPIMLVKWNQTGSLILSIDCTNTVVIWDSETGDIKQSFQPQYQNSASVEDGVPTSGTDADWIDPQTYASTAENAMIKVYKVGGSESVFEFKGHTKSINSIQFEEHTKLLASGSDDQTIRIWHGRSQSSVATLTGHTGAVLVVKWFPVSNEKSIDNRSLLCSGSADGTIRIWNAEYGASLATLSLHESAVYFCEISPCGSYLASGGADGVMILWDIRNIKSDTATTMTTGVERAIGRYQNNDTTNKTETDAESDQRSGIITSLSWNSDSTKLFIGYSDKSVIVDIPKTKE